MEDTRKKWKCVLIPSKLYKALEDYFQKNGLKIRRAWPNY